MTLHCRNEGRCIEFTFAPLEWREGDICRLNGCDGDTRTAVSERESMNIEDFISLAGKMEEAVRKDEREKVLKLIEESNRVLRIALERVESLTERATSRGMPVYNHGQFASLICSVIEENDKELRQGGE